MTGVYEPIRWRASQAAKLLVMGTNFQGRAHIIRNRPLRLRLLVHVQVSVHWLCNHANSTEALGYASTPRYSDMRTWLYLVCRSRSYDYCLVSFVPLVAASPAPSTRSAAAAALVSSRTAWGAYNTTTEADQDMVLLSCILPAGGHHLMSPDQMELRSRVGTASDSQLLSLHKLTRAALKKATYRNPEPLLR
jgi:hypothetical protein